jgi:hypothetical protein
MGDLYAAQIGGAGFHSFPCDGAIKREDEKRKKKRGQSNFINFTHKSSGIKKNLPDYISNSFIIDLILVAEISD